MISFHIEEWGDNLIYFCRMYISNYQHFTCPSTNQNMITNIVENQTV